MITTAPRLRVRTAPAVTIERSALALLHQLEGRRLRVALVPAPEPMHSGHKIRVVEERNPAWYRDLCSQYLTRRTRPRVRKPKYIDTSIKRRHVLRALAEISRGGVRSAYAHRIYPYVAGYRDWMNEPYRESIFEEE